MALRVIGVDVGSRGGPFVGFGNDGGGIVGIRNGLP